MLDDAEAYFDSIKAQIDSNNTKIELRAEAQAEKDLNDPVIICRLLLDAVCLDENKQLEKLLVAIANETNSKKLLDSVRTFQDALYAISYKSNVGGKL